MRTWMAKLWIRLGRMGLTAWQSVKRPVRLVRAAVSPYGAEISAAEVRAEIARLEEISERIRHHQPIGDLLRPPQPGWPRTASSRSGFAVRGWPGDVELQVLEPKVRLLFLWPVPLLAQDFELLMDVHCPLCRSSETLILDLPVAPTREECIRWNESIEQLLARARAHQREHAHFVLDLEAELDRVRALNAHLAQQNIYLESQLRDARGGIPDRWR